MNEPLTRNGNPYQFPTLDNWNAHVATLKTPETLTKWFRWLGKEATGSYSNGFPWDEGSVDMKLARAAIYNRATEIGAKYQPAKGGSKGFFYNVKEWEETSREIQLKHAKV